MSAVCPSWPVSCLYSVTPGWTGWWICLQEDLIMPDAGPQLQIQAGPPAAPAGPSWRDRVAQRQRGRAGVL